MSRGCSAGPAAEGALAELRGRLTDDAAYRHGLD
jgi:hypothetical protein